MKLSVKVFLLLIVSLLCICCKTKSERIKELKEIERICNKYEDKYENFIYLNKKLGLTLEFSGDWIINTDYESFDDSKRNSACDLLSSFSHSLHT